MSIRNDLAQAIGTSEEAEVSWEVVGNYLRQEFTGSQDDKARRDRARERHELYSGGGDSGMSSFIQSVFKDPEVLEKRQEWLGKSKYNNVSRRIVNERAVVYSVPARRVVKNESDNEKYQELQRQCRQHEIARRINRWGNLHGNLALGFRIRPDGKPVIDVVTPEHFFAVGHPLDPAQVIAIGIKLGHTGPAITKSSPAWMVWTDTEQFYLSESGHVDESSVTVHGLPRMPWVLFSSEPPHGKLIDDNVGEDVRAAHKAVWFMHLLELKEAKSATKQPILSGDLTAMARQQSSDSETPIELPDGVILGVEDFSMDLEMFRDSANSIYELVAGNHGISSGVLKHQGVQSAEARELMRAPLKELRREQEVYLRELEREFAEVQAMVLADEKHPLSFGLDGWKIDFMQSSTSLDPKTASEVFEHDRRLGLTNTVAEIIKRNPDLTVAEAFNQLESNILTETARNVLMRPLQSISGSLSESTPDNGDASQLNGRDESDAGESGEKEQA